MEAVRVRIGSGGPAEGNMCKCCGAIPLDSAGRHAGRCAIGEATRRHNGITSVLHGFCLLVDSDAALEVPNLVEAQSRSRPADLLISATGRLIGADLGVTSPDTAISGTEAAQNMYSRTQGKRRN